jgi:hypothetical protein
MNEAMGTDVMNTETPVEESGVGKYIAIGIATAFVAIGTGIGFVVGTKRGAKKGEEAAKAKLDAAVTKITETVQAATGAAPETPAAK